MTAKIVVVGSFNTDLVSYLQRMPRPGETVHGDTFATGAGGKGSNQAVAAARLGAEVTFIGRVGSDVFANLAYDIWDTKGSAAIMSFKTQTMRLALRPFSSTAKAKI